LLSLHSLITFFPETDSGIREQKANPHWVDQGANYLSFLFDHFVIQALGNLLGSTSIVLGFNFLVSSFIRPILSSSNWRRLWGELSLKLKSKNLRGSPENVWSTIGVTTPTLGGGGGRKFIQSLFWNIL
jgi:hypothetical protein